jgi:ankyrin repeat protein
MHYAAEHGRRNIILLLLHHGANVNLADWQKYTPLHYAILRGHRACVKVLLEAGADVNARTLGNFTPLHLAAKRGRDDTTLLLLDFGAKVNAKAKSSTPLHEAVKACNSSTVKILLDYGADVEAINANRKTPMMIAVLNRDQMTEDLLLGAGAFAGHLQSVKKPEEWPELKDEDEEYENMLSGMSPTSKKAKDGNTAAPKLANKFKSASLKVIKMM